MLTDKRCPAGRFCVAGLHNEPSATDCIAGHYCEEGGFSQWLFYDSSIMSSEINVCVNQR